MCTYPFHCFYCEQSAHLSWAAVCALCTFEVCRRYRVWLHFLPLCTPSSSCFSSASALLTNSGFCLVFDGGLVGGPALRDQRRRPPNTITGCFGLLHFTRSEGPDPSQLRAGRIGCCPSRWEPPPLISLMSCTLHITRARTLHPLCAGSERQGLTNYYNLVSRFWVIIEKMTNCLYLVSSASDLTVLDSGLILISQDSHAFFSTCKCEWSCFFIITQL